MTKKKVISNFGGWKSRNFSGKGKVRKFVRNRGKSETEGKSETGGNLKQRGKCIMVSEGMDAPAKCIIQCT